MSNAFFMEVERELTALGDPARAIAERNYLKVPSQFAMAGISVPKMRALGKALARQYGDDTIALAFPLFDDHSHDRRSLCLAMLSAAQKSLTPAHFPELVTLVRRSYTWAHVDWIGTDIASPLVIANPSLQKRLPALARDESFWVRRFSLLALHADLRRDAVTFPLFAKLAATMVDEREFFIRKAIGWSLREVGKRHPTLVYAFLREHRVAGLTFREGVKYLPAAMRRTLDAERDAATPKTKALKSRR